MDWTPPAPGWWLSPQRMIQTNLREIDASMDLAAYVAALRDAGANVVLFNVGGIVANYPTALPFHFRNPYLRSDLTAEVIGRLHAAGLRVIARFDFSKINEELGRRRPEWLSRDGRGEPFPPYNGQMPTCLNGGYQQEYMLEVLAEAIDRYPLDGVFFNMIGYPRSDYSGRQLGVCQCGNCRRRFREFAGLDLPKDVREGGETWRRYEEFQRMTIAEQFTRVNGLIKARSSALAICTYTDAGVDLIRKESNTPLGRWLYDDTERARRARLEFPGKQLANTAVHFIDIPFRHAAVSPFLTRQRLLQQMLNGAWLDFYCIGPFHAQEDRTGLDEVGDIFRFHRDHERWLNGATELADVALAADTDAPPEEFRGWMKVLTEAHLPYELTAVRGTAPLAAPALVVPVGATLDAQALRRLDAYVEGGGRLLLTGPPSAALACLGAVETGPVQPPAHATYLRLRPEDKARLADPLFDLLDLVFLEGEFWPARPAPDADGLLRLIPQAMYGPPEKCYYTSVSDVPGLHLRRHGKGAVAWFPWRPGAHYLKQGHAGHAALAVAALERLLGTPRRLRTSAPALVEINRRGDAAATYELISLINHTGLSDNVLLAPVPVHDIELAVTARVPVRSARLLHAGRELSSRLAPDGAVHLRLPALAGYEVLLLEYAR